jgi:hypothetical protein
LFLIICQLDAGAEESATDVVALSVVLAAVVVATVLIGRVTGKLDVVNVGVTESNPPAK